jgi:hypothetical protein
MTRWYQSCICDIVSMLHMSMHGLRMFAEPVFSRGRHGQESEEDREDSHQEGGKEDLKEKTVIVSATEKSPPPGRNPEIALHHFLQTLIAGLRRTGSVVDYP